MIRFVLELEAIKPSSKFIDTPLTVDIKREILGLMEWSPSSLLSAKEARNIVLMTRNWEHSAVIEHLSNILESDSLLEDVLSIQGGDLTVKTEGSKVLDAHFGGNIQVVPGVLIKRLVQKIFGLDLYSSGSWYSVFETSFISAMRPGDMLSFDFPRASSEGSTPRSSSEWQVLQVMVKSASSQEVRAIATIQIINGAALHDLILERLSLPVEEDKHKELDVSNLDKYLAQKEGFQFADNISEVTGEEYSTYYSRIDLRLIRDSGWDFNILEEAICQAITLAMQSREVNPKDSLITLSSSRMMTYMNFSRIQGTHTHLTFQVISKDQNKGCSVFFSLASDKWNCIANGHIAGRRMTKRVFEKMLKR